MEKGHLRENTLLGLGNPLLDITATTDESFLEKGITRHWKGGELPWMPPSESLRRYQIYEYLIKDEFQINAREYQLRIRQNRYQMKPNDAILAEEKHMPMYKELTDNFPVEYTAGGACQNSMRVAQWILKTPNVAAFMGCIGRDKFGNILESKAKEAGVHTFYQYTDTVPTGTCAVVVTDKGANRSLCANLSAANSFSKDHIDIPENRSVIENAKFFYITGFFLTVSPLSIMEVARHAKENNKPYCMNLSAPFLSEFFTKPMMEAMPYVDILFGNEQEAVTFSRIQKFDTEIIEEIALKICELPKENKKRSRIAVITEGQDPVIVAQDGEISTYPVMNLRPEEIIDTNGAGDAFVGGFLSQYIRNKSLDVCVKCGIYAATEVIKRSGCAFPKNPNFNED